MNAAQFLLMILFLLTGLVVGWMGKAHTTHDRYIQALAARHESATNYWDAKTSDIINNNTLERKRRDGKKTD